MTPSNHWLFYEKLSFTNKLNSFSVTFSVNIVIKYWWTVIIYIWILKECSPVCSLFFINISTYFCSDIFSDCIGSFAKFSWIANWFSNEFDSQLGKNGCLLCRFDHFYLSQLLDSSCLSLMKSVLVFHVSLLFEFWTFDLKQPCFCLTNW